MNNAQIQIATDCANLSAAGKIHFGDVVARLMSAGIERYHADYSRSEITYYMPDGSSCIIDVSDENGLVGPKFAADAIQAAVRQAQRGDIMYPEFVRLTSAAGCVGYMVLIIGRCVQYFGRNGEIHTERFPSAGS